MPSNLVFYPFSSPIILTDDLYVAYGGSTGTSTAAQRQVAYFISEHAISNYIGTLLSPTIVTGTYRLHPTNPIQTDWVYVNSINAATIYSRKRDSSCTFSTDSSCAYLRDATYGILDVNLKGSCGCNYFFDPYQIEVVYNAGLASGTVYNSPIMSALALYANDELDELLGISATPGGVGIIEWENQEYREKRMNMGSNSFGSTAVAQRVARLLRSFKRTRYSGL